MCSNGETATGPNHRLLEKHFNYFVDHQQHPNRPPRFAHAFGSVWPPPMELSKSSARTPDCDACPPLVADAPLLLPAAFEVGLAPTLVEALDDEDALPCGFSLRTFNLATHISASSCLAALSMYSRSFSATAKSAPDWSTTLPRDEHTYAQHQPHRIAPRQQHIEQG